VSVLNETRNSTLNTLPVALGNGVSHLPAAAGTALGLFDVIDCLIDPCTVIIQTGSGSYPIIIIIISQ
jgi:hypothetical protein